MCKASPGKTGGGVLARMRHLQGQMGESPAQGLGAGNPPNAKGSSGEDALPPLPPVLRLLSADVLTEACTLLDAKSLAAAAGVCRSFRDVCQGPYPWRHLCAREWALPPCDEEDGPRKPAAAGAGLPPRKWLQFRDSILGGDFRKLFPLIEQMPSGFDCALLRDSPANPNINDDDDDDDNQAGGEDAEEEGEAEGDDNVGGAPDDAAAAANNNNNNQAGAAPGAPPAPAPADNHPGEEEDEDEAEEEAGDFLIKGVRRRPINVPQPGSSAATSPAAPLAALHGHEADAAAAGAPPPAAAAAAAAAASSSRGGGGGRPRSSSGDVALQVEFRGGLGVGNRCVRADLPLPSTVLRERTGAGARSSLARHLETSPLALFRWLLAKMAATASGHSGGGGGITGARGGGEGSSPLSAASRFFAVQQQEEQQQQEEEGGGGVAPVEGAGGGHHAAHHHPLMAQGGWGPAGAGGGERRERSSSLPSAGEGWGGGGGGSSGRAGGQQEKPNLPRVLCFPVALERGVVDVTPRLVSYFEVTIMAPRVDPPHAIPDCIAVGVSEERFPLKGKMPGWDACSYGYHSDDGGAFHDAGSMLFKCGPSFGPGDVVGCGLDYSVGDDRADIFFTLNGESLPSNNNSSNDDGGGGGGGGGGGVGFAAFRGVKGTFYPTVGVDSACPVRINLGGEPFRFDLAGALRRGGQEAAARESVAQHDPQRRRPRAPSAAGAAAAAATARTGPSPSSPFSKEPSDPSSSMPRQSRQRSLPLPLPLPASLFAAASGTSSNSSSGSGSRSGNPDVALSY